MQKERNRRHYGLNRALITYTRFDSCITDKVNRLNWRYSFSAEPAPPILLSRALITIHDGEPKPENVGIKMNGAANCEDGYCKCEGNSCTEDVTLASDNFIFCNGQKEMTITFNTTEHDTEYYQLVMTPLPWQSAKLDNQHVSQTLVVKARGKDLKVAVDRVLGVDSRYCSSWGDPHVSGFDTVGSYVNMATGFNWLVKSDDGFIKVQVRHHECGPSDKSYKCTVSNTV
jgi:hypothetical protein